MASNEDIIKEADYYLNNPVNVRDASSHFGITRRTFQLHMKKLESIDPDKFVLVQDRRKSNEKMGVVVGGKGGKRKPTWTKEQAVTVAKTMLEKGLTYREAEEDLGIPKSTIYEMIHKGLDDEELSEKIHGLAADNKRQTNVIDVIRKYSTDDKDITGGKGRK